MQTVGPCRTSVRIVMEHNSKVAAHSGNRADRLTGRRHDDNPHGERQSGSGVRGANSPEQGPCDDGEWNMSAMFALLSTLRDHTGIPGIERERCCSLCLRLMPCWEPRCQRRTIEFPAGLDIDEFAGCRCDQSTDAKPIHSSD